MHTAAVWSKPGGVTDIAVFLQRTGNRLETTLGEVFAIDGVVVNARHQVVDVTLRNNTTHNNSTNRLLVHMK